MSNWWPRLMPRVSRPGRHLLAAEAGREGDVADGQRRAVEDLVAVEVRDGHLGGRDPPEVLLGVVVQVLAELRQVARADEALAPHHVRRVDLDVAVLLRVQVEHVRDERALQPRAPALEHVEARARDLHAALEVDDAELRAEVPVRLRLEVEGALRALLAHDLVLACRPCPTGTDGCGRFGRSSSSSSSLASAAARSPASPSIFALSAVLAALACLARLAGRRAADLLRQAVLLRLHRLRLVLEVAQRASGASRRKVDVPAEARISRRAPRRGSHGAGGCRSRRRSLRRQPNDVSIAVNAGRTARTRGAYPFRELANGP